MEIREVTPGPYRATKLWNEVTKYFRAEMPRRKHRQHFKKYQNCFTAAEAIDWLHQLLRNNSNFGPEVTRIQTIQLLRKFLKNHVIEDIKGRWGSENLDDNHHLYRFPSASPVRILPRQHLLSENTDNTTKQTESIFKLPHYSRRTPQKYAFRECQENIENIKSAALEEKVRLEHSRQITQADIEEIWRNIVLIHLQTILGIPLLEEILHPALVEPRYIMYNMTNTSKRGVVLLHDKSGPRSNDMSQPTYMGFERDVFKTVADYFLSLPEPLLTFQFYELFMNILVLCGYITIPYRSSGKSGTWSDLELSKIPHLNSFRSTECLLLSLLHRETDKKIGPETSETVLKMHTAGKECGIKLQHYNVACKCATINQLASGSCQNLPRLKNEQTLPLKLKTRCHSLEGIVETTSNKYTKDGFNALSQADIHAIPFTSNENQLLWSKYKANSSLDLWSDNIRQKQTCDTKRVSASSIPGQELFITNFESNHLCRSHSLHGNSNSSWCGIHAPVAEITVRPQPVVPLHQNPQNITRVVANTGSKVGGCDMAINKRLCRSATQLSENTFSPSSFLLTGTSHLLQPHSERVAVEALQICCLLIPPPNRRKLQLLMRMISRMSENVDMPRLHDEMGTKSLMIQTFSRCILCCEEEVDLDELFVKRLVSFLMDHHQEILEVPTYLLAAVQDHIETLRSTKIECLDEELSAIFPTYSYCERITSQEFDKQKIYTSQAAIAELLENIIKDRKLSLKDKKKKLKQFQKEYPQIYRNRFPTTESEAILFEDKPTIKQPMLSLHKPKFHTMRN